MAPTTTTGHTSTSSDETPSHDVTSLDLLGDMDTPATAIVADTDNPDQNNGGIVDSVMDDDKDENEIHGTNHDPVADDDEADEDDEFQDFEDADDGAINAEIMEHQTEPRPQEVELVTMRDKVDVDVGESTNAEMNGTDTVTLFTSDISAKPQPGADEDTTDDDFGDFEDAVADSSSSANGLVRDASNHSGETSNGFQDGITTTKELEPPDFPEVPCDDVMDGPILSAPTKTTDNDFAGPNPSTETEQYEYEFSGASPSSETKPTENELASSIPSTEMKPAEEEDYAIAIPSTEKKPTEAEFAGPLAPRDIDDNTQTTQLETPEATTTEVPSLVDGDDDDFGDFTNAPVETQADETEVQSIDSSLAKDSVQEDNQPFEDDFGDFEDAPVAGKIDENLPTSSSTVNHDVPNQDANKPSGGDEDDDFGDFGNFSDFQEPDAQPSEPSPATVDSINPFQLEIQTIIESSRNALAGVFGSFSDVDEQLEEADNTLLDDTVVTVKSVMDTIQTIEANETQWSSQALLDLLSSSPALRKEPPRVVISSECRDVNSPFVFPPYRSLSRGHQKQQHEACARSTSSSRPYVPEVLPIQLPSGVDTPEGTRATMLRSWNGSPEEITDIPLAPLTDSSDSAKNDDEFADFQSSDEIIEQQYNISMDTETDAKQNVSSTTAHKLLQQIPDLSFMLKSTLSLPNKNT